MACFGIEGIDDFSDWRNSGEPGAEDTSNGYFVWDICDGLDEKLRGGGHRRSFYKANDGCGEIDMREAFFGGGGSDYLWSDNVDLFFICTHGNRGEDGRGYLQYNNKRNQWHSHSSTWWFGNQNTLHRNNNNCEWLMIYGCSLVDKNKVEKYYDVFQGLHEICAGWDTMYGWFSTDECGREVGDKLIHGETVANAWIDGMSDWFLDNHPIVIAAETRAIFNDGEILWSESTINNDHFWGHGLTVPDILPQDKVTLSYMYAEG